MTIGRRAAVVTVVVASALAACTSAPTSSNPSTPTGSGPAASEPEATSTTQSSPTTEARTGTGRPTSVAAYDSIRHTASRMATVEEFELLARTGVGGQQATKFSILGWNDAEPVVDWLDGRFYDLHDEWYYFQLLNGRALAGVDVEPVDGLKFETVAEIYDWAEARDDLPLDLRFTGLGRLTSGGFYSAALDDPDERPIALGKVIRIPAGDRTPERWLLELEFRDGADAADIERYFEILTPTLPAEIAAELVWVPRSREQELVADDMRERELPFGDRTVRYADIVERGAVEVYASGVSAGRLLLISDDGRWALSDAEPTDVVVVERTPDALPPGSAFITSTPQTPLSHVNVLAINRGIPNAFLGGAAADAELEQLSRARAPVAIRAVAPDRLDIRPLTDDEYRHWLGLRGREPIAVEPVDTRALPYVISLAELRGQVTVDGSISERLIDEVRPAVGGKSTGFLGLAAPGTVTMPDRPVAITVRAYREHVAPLDAIIADILASREFRRSTRARIVLTEGIDHLADVDPSDAADAWIDDFVRDHPPGTPLGDVVAAGGLKQMIRDLDVDPEMLDEIMRELADNFADYSPGQGLRFRSSSSVEDIEGFNGAGLYSSNTGFLDPTVLPDPDDHDRTVARALTRTWSSYWNIEAVEERILENVDHLTGAMAVLVHARFDDPLERSNGVATYTILPNGDSRMELNVQDGATSVTNPDGDPDESAEVVVVRIMSDGSRANPDPLIERVAASSLVADGDAVLDDDQILTIHDQLAAVTTAWLERINSELPVARRHSTLTLDFEFREMADGWPALHEDHTPFPTRIVIKQARTLEPDIRRIPDDLRTLPIPADVLARAVRIEQVSCPSAGGDGARLAVFTDPLASVDMGYSTEALIVEVSRDDGSPCSVGVLFSSPSDYLTSLFAAD